MKIKALFLSSLVLILLAPGLHASSMIMGRLMSVHPYGAQDAARNPALITRIQTDNALGLLAGYDLRASGDIRMRAAKPAISKPKLGDDKKIAARLSYVRKVGPAALSLDSINRYETSDFSGMTVFYDPALPMNGLVRGSDSSKTLLHSGIISAGYAITPRHSLGIQAIASYRKTTAKEAGRGFGAMVPPPPVYLLISDNSSTSEDVTLLPSIGYHGKISHVDFGLVFSTGMMNWSREKQRMRDFQLDGMLITFKQLASGKIPFHFAYANGPGITAGVCATPWESIAMALELEINFPVSYEPRFLTPAGPLLLISSSVLKMRNKVTVDPCVSLRGGVEIPVSRSMAIGAGGGIDYGSSTMSMQSLLFNTPLDYHYTHRSSFTAYGSAGVDFHVNRASVVTIGAIVSYARIRNEETLENIFYTFSREIHTGIRKMNLVTVDMIAAASIGF